MAPRKNHRRVRPKKKSAVVSDHQHPRNSKAEKNTTVKNASEFSKNTDLETVSGAESNDLPVENGIAIVEETKILEEPLKNTTEDVHSEDDPTIDMDFDLDIDLDMDAEIDKVVNDESAANSAKEETTVNGDERLQGLKDMQTLHHR